MMNATLLLAPDLLEVMRSAAHRAAELGEPLITKRCIVLAMLSDAGDDAESLRDLLHNSAETEEDSGKDTLTFKTPDGSATVPLGHRAYAVFIEGAERAAERYTRAELSAALCARPA